MMREETGQGGSRRKRDLDVRGALIPMREAVRLDEIHRSDEFFSMNFDPDLDRLRASIEEVGMLQAMWLRRKGRGFQIVNGFRRFDVAESLGIAEVPALVWEGTDLDDRWAFRMSLHDNVLSRELNLVEKGLVLDRLMNRFSVSRSEVIQTYLPLLGLEPHGKVLEGFLAMNIFSLNLKRILVRHGLGIANTMMLGTFRAEERESVGRLLSALRPGENVLREILTFLKEISARDRVGIDELLSDEEIQAVLSDPRLSKPQKVQAIRGCLREKRYPSLSALQERFESLRKAMSLSPQVALSPPPFFEGDRYKVEFSFRNLEEYEAIVGQLQDLSGDRIRDLLSIKGYDPSTD